MDFFFVRLMARLTRLGIYFFLSIVLSIHNGALGGLTRLTPMPAERDLTHRR